MILCVAGDSKIGKNPMKKSILAAMTLTFATFGASAQVVITTSTIAAGGITAGDAAGYPATISWSGSYKLGENIQSASSGNFIEITGNDVTLDLNGFSVLTSNSCSKTGHPTGNTCVGSVPTAQILVKITGSRVTVKNGSVSGSNGQGIVIGSSGVRLESVTVSNSKSNGITASVGGSGIAGVKNGTMLTGVTSILNGGLGFDGPGPGTGDVVIRNSVFSDNNGGALLYNANVSDVTASYNQIYGVRGGRATLERITAIGNVEDGVTDGAVVTNSVADLNQDGFRMQGGNGTVYVADSASSNTDKGFQLVTNGCYSNIYAENNTGGNISGGVALTGTHVTCP